MRNMVGVLAAAAALIAGIVAPAAAYVGPGAGLSLVGAFWGLLLAVGAALGFIIFWPVRRLLKRGRAQPASVTSQAAASTDEPS